MARSPLQLTIPTNKNSGQQQKSSQLDQLEHSAQNNNKERNNSQLDKLEYKKQNDNKTNSCKDSLGKHNELPSKGCKTTLACWNLVQQEHQSKKQQQPATAFEKSLEHKRCIDNNFREELSLGSLEAEPQATKLAYRSQKHNNNNNSILGLGTKNTAAYGILIDTGAAVSLAPLGFAQEAELQPLGCTLQLRSVTGNLLETFGRRTIQLVGSHLSLCVSFVIANVQHALLGMDALVANQLSLVRNSFNEFFLVNAAGATTQLQSKGHLLYLEAWPYDSELSPCRGSSFQEENGSLLNDKIGTQEGALTTSGGACADSFYLENLRQQQDKNTAALGTTALPERGAKKKRRRRKKPAAKQASQVQCDKRSLEQQGQKPVATHLRNLGQLRIIKEIEIATEQNKESLGSMTIQELSLRILLTLSLRNEWLITTTRARGACSESALGEHLRHIGLSQNKMDQNIFSGDELVLLVHKKDILIGGTEMQQEELFCELSALLSLEQPKKLEQDAPISFCNRILEYQTSSHSINLSLGTCFVRELLCRHELENEEPLDDLDAEKPCQDAVEQSFALDACRQELYRHTVGELSWAAKACRPDLCFEVHLLTQSLDNPTTLHEQQLYRVLRYLAGTLHHTLSLHTRTKMPKERAMNMEILAFSASSWTSPCRSTCSAYLLLWETPLIASCKTSWANNQEEAELQGVNFALAMAVHTRKLLQHLDMDQLGKDVHIGVRTTSFNEVLVTGRPIAMQLGLSRRNRHIQVGDQLQLSRVSPSKNLAHSLIHNPPSQMLLAKLRVNKGAAETLALSTVLSFASFVSSSSLVVGMVSLEHPKMESEQLRQLALKSETCFESLSKNLADKSLPSLTVPSLSLETIDSDSLTLCSLSFQLSRRDRFSSLTKMSLSLREANLHSLILSNWSFPTGSLTLYNLSRREDRLQSLTLQSLSLNQENGFQRMSFEQVSLQDGNLKETENTLANNIASGGAETNSLPQHSFEDQLAGKEDGTNIFSQRFLDGILSLSICLLIFLSSFQLTCSALSFGICYLSGIFPKKSLQPEELVAAYCTMIFEPSQKRGSQQDSFQKEKLTNNSFDNNHLCRTQLGTTTLGSFQLDLATSLSLPEFSQTRSRSQLQPVSFEHSSFEQRALHGAALFQDIRIRNRQLQSFQLSEWQLGVGMIQGGAFSRSSHRSSQQQPALHESLVSTASTLISLSLAQVAWLKASGKKAWSRRSLQPRSSRRPLPTSAWQFTTYITALPTTFPSTTTSSLTRTLSIFLFSFLFTNFFFSTSFESCPLGLFHGHLGQEAHCLDQLQCYIFTEKNKKQKKKKKKPQLSEAMPDKELAQLHLFHLHHCQLHLSQQPFRGRKQLPEEQSFTSCPLRQMISSFSNQKLERLHLTRSSLTQNLSQNQLGFNQFLAENFGHQLSEQQLQQNLSTDQRQLQKNQLTQHNLQQLSLYQPSLEQTSFEEKILHKQFATTFAKNSFGHSFVLQTFLFDSLAFQTLVSDQLGQNNLEQKQLAKNSLYQKQLEEHNFAQTEEACKEQLLTTGFPEASLNKQPFSTSLVQHTDAKAASTPDLLPRELPEEELADKNFEKNTFAAPSLPTRPSTSQLQKNKLEEEHFTETSFEALCLSSFQALCLPSLQGTACKEELLSEQLFQQQLSSRNFQPDSFSPSSLQDQSFRPETFQPAALQPGPSARQLYQQQLERRNLQQQQLGRNNSQDRSFQQDSFDSKTFKETSLDNTTFEKTSFPDKSLAEESFADSSFAQPSFIKSSLATSSSEQSFAKTLAEKNLPTYTFEENFADKSFPEHLAEKSFTEKSFAEETFQEATFAKQTLPKSSFARSSLHNRSLQASSLAERNFKRRALALSSLPRAASKTSFDKKSFDKKSFDKSFEPEL